MKERYWWPDRAALGQSALPLLALTPMGLVASQRLWGDDGLVAAALVTTALAVAAWLASRGFHGSTGRDGETGLPDRKAALRHLAELDARGEVSGRRVAAVAVGVDGFDDLRSRFGDEAVRTLMVEASARLQSILRSDDLVARIDEAAFGLVLANLHRADLEVLIQIAGRVQRELSEGFEAGGRRIYPTVSAGFCLPNRAPDRSGAGLLRAAERALDEARRETGGVIRAYSRDMAARQSAEAGLAEEVASALASGEIRPWFQPMVSCDTGAVTGAEALARWVRRDGTVAMPGEFLGAIEAQGLGERLGEVVLSHALSALSACDAAGHTVPEISVNLGRSQLKSSRFVDRVRWELDRFDTDASRLRFEVRETIARDGADDMTIRGLRALTKLGCHVDLDDFGTGATPLADIPRLSVSRLKIDRSFVQRIDRDEVQRRIVSAIITLAGNLGIETVGVGAETLGEHAVLTGLGCDHVQGFAVAQPMPAEALGPWLAARRAHSSPMGPGGSRYNGAGPKRGGKTA